LLEREHVFHAQRQERRHRPGDAGQLEVAVGLAALEEGRGDLMGVATEGFLPEILQEIVDGAFEVPEGALDLAAKLLFGVRTPPDWGLQVLASSTGPRSPP